MVTHMLVPIEKFQHRRTVCGLPRGLVREVTEEELYASCQSCQALLHKEHHDMKDKPTGREQLMELGLIHSDSLIKAIEKRIPQPNVRARMMATIAAEERRKDAKSESVRDLASWLEDYKGRRVEIPSQSVDGIMTDAKKIGDTNLVAIVIDGTAHTVYSDESAWVWPEEPARPDRGTTVSGVETKSSAIRRAREEQKRNDQRRLRVLQQEDTTGTVYTTVDTLFNNAYQYNGYHVNIGDKLIGGVFTDAWTARERGWYMLVIDGKMHCVGGKTPANIHMPKEAQPKMFIKQKADTVRFGLKSYKGRYVKLETGDDEGPVWGGVLTDATKRSDRTCILVLDGQIYTFANDTEVLVEIPVDNS